MANLSDIGAAVTERALPDWMQSLAADRGFVPLADVLAKHDSLPCELPAIDTLQAQIEEAFLAGEQQGRALACEEHEQTAAHTVRLLQSLARLDEAARAALEQEMVETVTRLCEQVIAPHLVDRTALEQRCQQAIAVIEGLPAQLTLHLHPDDAALLEQAGSIDVAVSPAPEQQRGSLLLEGPEGLVADGPDTWRRAIAKALHP